MIITPAIPGPAILAAWLAVAFQARALEKAAGGTSPGTMACWGGLGQHCLAF